MEGCCSLRRPTGYWNNFNKAWRDFADRTGKRFTFDDIERWYEGGGKDSWSASDRPSLEEVVKHSRGIRSREESREYFRYYRRLKKRKSGKAHDGGEAEAGEDAPSRSGSSDSEDARGPAGPSRRRQPELIGPHAPPRATTVARPVAAVPGISTAMLSDSAFAELQRWQLAALAAARASVPCHPGALPGSVTASTSSSSQVSSGAGGAPLGAAPLLLRQWPSVADGAPLPFPLGSLGGQPRSALAASAADAAPAVSTVSGVQLPVSTGGYPGPSVLATAAAAATCKVGSGAVGDAAAVTTSQGAPGPQAVAAACNTGAHPPGAPPPPGPSALQSVRLRVPLGSVPLNVRHWTESHGRGDGVCCHPHAPQGVLAPHAGAVQQRVPHSGSTYGGVAAGSAAPAPAVNHQATGRSVADGEVPVEPKRRRADASVSGTAGGFRACGGESTTADGSGSGISGGITPQLPSGVQPEGGGGGCYLHSAHTHPPIAAGCPYYYPTYGALGQGLHSGYLDGAYRYQAPSSGSPGYANDNPAPLALAQGYASGWASAGAASALESFSSDPLPGSSSLTAQATLPLAPGASEDLASPVVSGMAERSAQYSSTASINNAAAGAAATSTADASLTAAGDGRYADTMDGAPPLPSAIPDVDYAAADRFWEAALDDIDDSFLYP